MIRLTEIKLPLEHAEAALEHEVLDRLGIERGSLIRYSIFRRGVDARRRSQIAFIYTVDAEVANESTTLARLKDARNITRTPDTGYRFVATAPANMKLRPVIIGTGPCGFLAGLLLAQMGFRPLILERGKIVRERTQDKIGRAHV